MEIYSPPEETTRRKEQDQEQDQEQEQEQVQEQEQEQEQEEAQEQVQEQEQEQEEAREVWGDDFWFASNACEVAVAAIDAALAKAKAACGRRKDFHFGFASNPREFGAALEKAKAKEGASIFICDIANVVCALVFQTILLFYRYERQNILLFYGFYCTFEIATPFYLVHIMLNVKRNSLLLSLPSNNRRRNDDETNDTNIPTSVFVSEFVSMSVSFAKMGACVCAVWIIRSLFGMSKYEDLEESICWAVWFTGSIFNLQFLTHEINSLHVIRVHVDHHRSQIKPFFHVLSLLVGWVANILCLMAVVVSGMHDSDLLFIALMVYTIHSILFGLSMCFGHILYECFPDEHLLAAQRRSDDDDNDICRGLRKDDMVKIICLSLMPILMMARDEVIAFMGGVLYLLYTILEIRTRKVNNNGTSSPSDMTTIRILGGIMSCIGSLFFCKLTNWCDFTIFFAIFWMIGCFCNIFVITRGLGGFAGLGRDGQARPLFKVLFVWTRLAGNILTAAGATLFVFQGDPPASIEVCLMVTYGFACFFIQPFFLTLSMIYGHVVLLIHISTPAARPGSSLGDQPAAAGTDEFKIPLLDKKNDISRDTTIIVV